MTNYERIREEHIDNSYLQHIARISGGKDGLKMLDVIFTRGLPLDRITTTDVWATDTIRAELPPMVKFKDRVDEYVWDKYRIEVEHLCAVRNGEKLTYEKMFYHIPQRKPLRERERRKHPPGEILGFPTKWGSWCQTMLKRRVAEQTPRFSCTDIPLVPETQNRLYTASRYQLLEEDSGARNSKHSF